MGCRGRIISPMDSKYGIYIHCIVRAKMSRFLFWVLLLLSSVVVLSSAASDDDDQKSSVYHSPPFFLRPGSVVEKYYFSIPFPSGHTALKRFDAEVVDEMGVSVPLYETYLHHWNLFRYYARKGSVDPKEVSAVDPDFLNLEVIYEKNAGICEVMLGLVLAQGSETRKLSTWIPGPYGIEAGNPEEAPVGYEERWLLIVHAIDTRDVEDRLGCTECRCGLYNVSKGLNGDPLPKNYIGGLQCCYDQSQCRTREGGVEGAQLRKLYLKYTINWVDWSESVVPVKIYMFDVTDAGILSNDTFTGNDASNCKVEYEVKACGIEGRDNGKYCVDAKKTTVVIPHGGEIIYGVGHQHSGGVGIALYGEDGRALCTSIPYYGKGNEAGNESGYIVGMSTCYPAPGSVKVADGEHLTLISSYNNSMQHTGVMGFFTIYVADPQPKPVPTLRHTRPVLSWVKGPSDYAWVFIVAGGFIAAAIGVLHRRRYNGDRRWLQELATA